MRYLLVLLLILHTIGCDSDPITEPVTETPPQMNNPPATPVSPDTPMPAPPPVAPPNTPEEAPPTASEIESQWGDGTDVNLAPPPTVIEPGRARRRMNLDQLESAFQSVSGGLNWTEQQGGNQVSLFRTLSATLGKPDYIQTTTEVLEPTALFQKFLDDAARQVCEKMVSRDMERPGDAILVRDEAGEVTVDEHLQMLLLRFHQRDLGAGSADLGQWRWLYDSVVFMTDSPAERWNTVCVALFTHPDFYTY
jgi:hypothetical protein